jgi:hypothetical protein
MLRKKLAEVRISCGDYQCFVSRVNIGVKHLQLGEERPSLSYIEEWMQEQVAVSAHSPGGGLIQTAIARHGSGLPVFESVVCVLTPCC